MATIEKRTVTSTDRSGNEKTATHYRVKVRLRGYPPETATFERITDAKTWAAKLEAEMKAGRYFGQSRRHTLAELIERYETSELPKLKSAQSVKRRLGWWKNELGERLLVNLTPDVIAQARDKLLATPKQIGGGQRTGADVNRTLAALSSACSYAMKELGWLEKNPCERVSKPKESSGRIRFLDADELPRLLATCKKSTNKDLYLAVLLSLTTGGRQSEILGLRWSQIDMNKRIAIFGDTKNGDSRSIPLSGKTVPLLQERMKIRRLNDDRIFPPEEGAIKTPYVNLRKPWVKALQEAEIEDFHWHDLRHTAASYLIMNDVGLVEVAKILGHKTLNMVLRYAHLAHQHTVKLGDILAKALGVL
jgi:integrase